MNDAALLRDLVAHHGWANATLLASIRASDGASTDPEVLGLLHHVLIANRFWLLAIVGEPFVHADEDGVPRTLESLAGRLRATHERQAAWIRAAAPADLARGVEDARVPGGGCTVAEALTQVCLHAHGHRAQTAALLRRHGALPPTLDYIVWRAARAAPAWGG